VVDVIAVLMVKITVRDYSKVPIGDDILHGIWKESVADPGGPPPLFLAKSI